MDWQTVGVIVGIILGTLTFARFIGGGSWKISSDMATMKTTLFGVQTEIKRQGDLLEELVRMSADVRVANNRIDNVERRVGSVEQDIRELRHGEGYVLPLNKSAFEK